MKKILSILLVILLLISATACNTLPSDPLPENTTAMEETTTVPTPAEEEEPKAIYLSPPSGKYTMCLNSAAEDCSWSGLLLAEAKNSVPQVQRTPKTDQYNDLMGKQKEFVFSNLTVPVTYYCSYEDYIIRRDSYVSDNLNVQYFPDGSLAKVFFKNDSFPLPYREINSEEGFIDLIRDICSKLGFDDIDGWIYECKTDVIVPSLIRPGGSAGYTDDGFIAADKDAGVDARAYTFTFLREKNGYKTNEIVIFHFPITASGSLYITRSYCCVSKPFDTDGWNFQVEDVQAEAEKYAYHAVNRVKYAILAVEAQKPVLQYDYQQNQKYLLISVKLKTKEAGTASVPIRVYLD
ncbi:MAG: hypothetical protein E7664_05850 [Ruminococcaceae bacterium]|nr:hypothetical protein [Oscillospiraceae bacterium]